MKLAAYLKKHQLSQQAFAKSVGVTQAMVWHWLNGKHITAERALEIEQATNGEVDRMDLRPELFKRKVA